MTDNTLLTSTLFLAIISRHHYTPPTPAVSALLPPYSGTHSLLAFTLVLHHIISVVFLKATALIRPSVPPRGSHKCLRFGLWLTLCTIKYFVYLLNYLLTLPLPFTFTV